jgi:hypothetical protein
MMESTKENTLYLTIKQVYFDQIVAGKKKEEYRTIKDTTYKKYLECDEEGYPYFDDEKISADDPLAGDIFVWNNGVYPFFPKDDLQYLNLAVGYAKERDTALVEVTDITFRPLSDKDGKPARFRDNCEDAGLDPNGEFCFWETVFHLGKIVDVKRK